MDQEKMAPKWTTGLFGFFGLLGFSYWNSWSYRIFESIENEGVFYENNS